MPPALPTPQRYRGFVLTVVGLQKLHERIKQLEAQTRLRQSPRTLAERVQLSDPNGIHPITIRKILAAENGVDKRSLQLVFQVLHLQLEETDFAHAGLSQNTIEISPETLADASPKNLAWNETVNEFRLQGRVAELAQLHQAITQEHCHLVEVLGIAGIGKTALARMLMNQVQPEFEFVIWKSLRHAPTLQAILTSILQLLNKRSGNNIRVSTHVEELTEVLIEQLQSHRCLIIFDHFNSILSSKQYAGYCRSGYEFYGHFLQMVSEISHQSCLMITSREKPRVIGVAEHGVRSLQLKGLSALEWQQISDTHYGLIGTTDEWQLLNERSDGNPFVFNAIASDIQNYFGGHISDYLNDLNLEPRMSSALRDLISQQFDRLSSVEQELIYHLASYRNPISVSQLRKNFGSSSIQQNLLEGLDSLSRRSFLHQQGAYFSLDTLINQYACEYFIPQRDNSLSKPRLEIVSS